MNLKPKVKTFYGTNGAYLTVYRLAKFKLFRTVSICLHHFHRPDEDPYCHDHPFHFFTMIIRGWYWEETIDGKLRIRNKWSCAFHKADFLHRIYSISKRPCWSLCIKISPKKERKWGFMVNGNWVYWRDFIRNKGLLPFDENAHLDPQYVQKLMEPLDEKERRKLLEGDWNGTDN